MHTIKVAIRIALLAALTSLAVVGNAHENYTIVDIGDVGNYWNFKTKAAWPSFPNSSMRKSIYVCFAVGFSVESDGTPGHISILHMQTSKPADQEESERMKQAMLDGISAWRFVPAESNMERRPLYTYTITSMAYSVRGSFPATNKKHANEVSRACVIPDFVESVSRGEIGVNAAN